MKSPADSGGMEDISNIFRFLLENSGQNDLRLVLVGSFFFFFLLLASFGNHRNPEWKKGVCKLVLVESECLPMDSAQEM